MTNRVRICTATTYAIAQALVLVGCSGSTSVPVVITSPTPIATPAPSPSTARFTLSGIVSEASAMGHSPLAGAELEVAVCPPLNGSAAVNLKTRTDTNGFYSVSDMCSGVTYVWVSKAGYKTSPTRQCDGDCLFATISGDTRFDIELVRQ